MRPAEMNVETLLKRITELEEEVKFIRKKLYKAEVSVWEFESKLRSLKIKEPHDLHHSHRPDGTRQVSGEYGSGD